MTHPTNAERDRAVLAVNSRLGHGEHWSNCHASQWSRTPGKNCNCDEINAKPANRDGQWGGGGARVGRAHLMGLAPMSEDDKDARYWQRQDHNETTDLGGRE